MKLLRCNLRSFGQFNNCSLEFDPSKNFHFIYGENESGKSTFTRAFLALLFGIEKNSPDAYLQDLDSLFLEGLIQTRGGKFHHIHRQYRLSKKLNLEMQNLFPQINKLSFSQNFILNDENLHEGAKDLVEHLNQFDMTFFKNATGLHKIKEVLKQLEDCSDDLFKLRGSKPKINQYFAEYESLQLRESSSLLSYSNYIEKKNILSTLLSEKEILGERKEKLSEIKKIFDFWVQIKREYKDYMATLSQIEILKNNILKNPLEISFDRNVWPSLKTELRNRVKRLIVKKTQLQGLKNKRESLELKKETLKKELLKTPHQGEGEKLKNLLLKGELFLQKEKLFRELYSEIGREEQTLLVFLKKIGFTDRIDEEIVAMRLPSKIEAERFSELDCEVESRIEALNKEKSEWIKERDKIAEEIKYISLKGNFDLKDFYLERKNRTAIEEKLNFLWVEKDKNFLKELFNDYLKRIQIESNFVDLFINESEAFVRYQTLQRLYQDCEKNLQNNLYALDKLKKQREEQDTIIQFYKAEWKIESLNSSLFQTIAKNLSNIQAQLHKIKDYEKSKNELEGERIQLECEIKRVLGKEEINLTLLLKRLNEHLVHNEAALQCYRIQKNQCDELEQDLQSFDLELERINREMAIEDNEWNKLLTFHKISESIHEEAIEDFISNVEKYFSQKKEIERSQSQVLEQQKNNLIELFTLGKALNPLFTSDLENLQNNMSTQPLLSFNKIEEIYKKLAYEYENTAQELLNLSKKISTVDQEIGKINQLISQSYDTSEKKRIEGEFQNLNFELESKINHYLTLQLSLYLLKKEIRDYQKKNQGELIHKISNYFKTLTNGSYDEVYFNILNEKSFLTCKSSLGEVGLTSLSRGTQDQLFLSLKLSLIELYIEQKEPLPILLDDILIQFDDCRASQALKVFAELSTKTQVIFLTHNRHLLELAAKVLDKEHYQIHFLQNKSPKSQTASII